MPHQFRLGKKTNKFFCFALDFFVTLASPKLLTLGNKKKKEIFFCIALVFS